MRPHHQRALDVLIDQCRRAPQCQGLILVGSLATGQERDSSDIDYIKVVSDAEFARRRGECGVHELSSDFCDWPGGYAEGKTVNLAFLRAAAERGSEPARWAFTGARVVYSEVPDLESLVASIPVYPVAEQADKITRFYAHLKVWQGYVACGEKVSNPYIVMMAASRVALLAGRIVLARNRTLFPYHKWFRAAVAAAADKPAGFDEQLDAFLARPTGDGAEGLQNTLDAWLRLDTGDLQWISRFVMDAEWNWLDAPPPIEDA